MSESRKRVSGTSINHPVSNEQIVDLMGDDDEPPSKEQKLDMMSKDPVDYDLISQFIKPMTPATAGHPALIYITQEPLSPGFIETQPFDYSRISQFIKEEQMSPGNIENQPLTHAQTATHKPFQVQSVFPDEDDDVIMGMEDFNPKYLKREPFSPSDSDLSTPPSVEVPDDEDQEQTGAGGFTITDKQSAHANYLSNITLKPKQRTGHLIQVLEDLEQPLTEQLTALLGEHRGIKVYIVIDVEYESIIDANKLVTDHLHTHFLPVFSVAEIPQLLTAIKEELVLKNENFVQFKSGLRLKNIPQITMAAAEHQPLAGKGFQELPPFLANKKCIINVKNRDNRCFGYALLASLEPAAANQNKPYSYNQYFAKHHLDSLPYPVKPADIHAIEANLPIAINVFSFDDDAGISRFPVYNSRKKNVPVIDLLYWNEHFALITKFNSFMCDINKHKGRQHFCRQCFGHFQKEQTLENHQRYCLGFNGCKTNIRMPPENSKCEFKNIKNQLKCPFVVYADFECLLQQNQNQGASQPGKTVMTQKHIPYSVGFKLVGPDLRTPTNQDYRLDYANYPYEFHSGDHSAEWLLMRLMKLESAILKVVFDDKRLVMTEEDSATFAAATKCHICDKGWELDVEPVRRAADTVGSLESKDEEESDLDEEEEVDPEKQGAQPKIHKWLKVRDHDHLTGKYRGAAHNHCNWQYRKQFTIPVFFHNLKNYDGHLIVRAMENFPKYQIKPIAQGLEKYLIIGWGRHLVFKDTLQFMAASLEQLAKNLLNKGKEHFVHLHRGFNETPARMDLIMRKGVFPYDFMRNWKSVDFRMLPSRQNFYNNLKQSECSVEDYQHAQTVWSEFGCQTMKDYSELYMKTGKFFIFYYGYYSFTLFFHGYPMLFLSFPIPTIFRFFSLW